MSTSSNRVWMSFGWGLGTPVTRPRSRSPRGLQRALGFLKENSEWNGEREVWRLPFQFPRIMLVAALTV